MRVLSVGELATRSGVSVSALHFYERQGLIQSWRSAGNQRRYASGMLRKIAIIQFAQSLGISLKEIADMLATLPEGRLPDTKDWQDMASQWAADLDRRILGLQLLRDRLTDCIGCGCLSTQLCPLRNPGDKLAAGGTGPRRLHKK